MKKSLYLLVFTFCFSIITHAQVANAGEDVYLCLPENSTLLTATGTDQHIYGFWEIFQGSGSFSSVLSPNTLFLNAGIGENILVWKIYDDTVTMLDSDTISVFVHESYTTTAGSDVFVFDCQSDEIVLQGSNLPEGATGEWIQIIGPETISLSDVNDPNAQITAEFHSAATFVWQVSGVENCVVSLADTVVITSFFEDPYLPYIGPDQTFSCAQTVQLDSPNYPNFGQYMEWSIVQGSGIISDPHIPNPTISGLSVGETIVRLTNFGVVCSNPIYDEMSILVFDGFPINASPDFSICQGQSVTLNVSGPANTTISWSPAGSLSSANISNPIATPFNTTNYTVTVTDANGCSTSESVLVSVNPLPIVNAGMDQTICAGTTANLLGTFFSNTPITGIQWTGVGLDNSTILNPIATTPTSTTYTLTVANVFGCVASDAMLVNVTPLPDVFAGMDQTICLNQGPIQLMGSPMGGIWSGVGITPSGLFSPFAAGAYVMTYTYINTNGCAAVDQVVITVLPFGPLCGEIAGCMDTSACNFNPDANSDDGSCTYSAEGDVDCNGTIDVSDLTDFMANFGCVGLPECEAYDLDGDGVVGTSDLMILISNL
jgi:hypothetical protein